MKNFFFSALMLVSFITLAQKTYELEPDEKKGQVILKDGTVLEGYIKLNGDERSPWKNQERVEFFTEEAMEDGKVKKKERTRYSPQKIKAYVAEGRYFESMAISIAKMTLGFGFKDDFFVERMVDGDMKMYRFYDSPDPMAVNVGEEAIAAYEQELEEMRTNPNILLQKGDEDMVILEKIDFGDYLSGCPGVQEKYNTGGYGFEPYKQDAETKLGKLISKSVNSSNIVAVLPQIVTDYNNCTP